MVLSQQISYIGAQAVKSPPANFSRQGYSGQCLKLTRRA